MALITPAERQGLIVSVSQVSTYMMCPKKYEYRYVLKAEPEHRASALVLGIAVHAALANWYLAHADGRDPDKAEFFSTFIERFDAQAAGDLPVHVNGDRSINDERDEGLRLLQAFWEASPVPEKVIAVEQPFCVDVVDPATGVVLEEQLVGYIDGVIEEDGKTVLLEHKTAARRWAQDRLDFDLQIGTYLAVTDAEAVRLQLLLKTKQAQLVTQDLVRTEKQRAEALATMCRVLDGIRSGAYWRNRGWACRGCEYQFKCG